MFEEKREKEGKQHIKKKDFKGGIYKWGEEYKSEWKETHWT